MKIPFAYGKMLEDRDFTARIEEIVRHNTGASIFISYRAQIGGLRHMDGTHVRCAVFVGIGAVQGVVNGGPGGFGRNGHHIAVQADFGVFPISHKEADLWLMDLETGETRPIDEVNSDCSESFHNWSSDSRWFLFSSRRDDGNNVQIYLASIDADGHCTKPFVLPQRNPRKYYRETLYSFNQPDFTKSRVDFKTRGVYRDVMSDQRIQATVKP